MRTYIPDVFEQADACLENISQQFTASSVEDIINAVCADSEMLTREADASRRVRLYNGDRAVGFRVVIKEVK